MKIVHTSKGFTLIELLVVIAIISLISSVVLASLKSARDKAIDTAVMEEVRTFQEGMELYRSNNPTYYTTITPMFNDPYVRAVDTSAFQSFITAVSRYISVDKLRFVNTQSVFHYVDGVGANYYNGLGFCGGIRAPMDGYLVFFWNPSPTLNLQRWNTDPNFYCFTNN